MSTLAIEYDDQQVIVKLIRSYETVEVLYIDKHTEMEDIANQLYQILDEVAGSFDVSIEEGVE